MKNVILLISCILFLQQVSAQYTQVPDPNFEQALIDLGIDSEGTLDGQFLTADANGVLEYNETNGFDFEYAEWVLGGCENNSNDDYSILYEIFWSGATTIPIVTYNIVDINDTRTLTINGANNNIAIYGTQILSVSSQGNNEGSIKIIPTIAENKIKIILKETTIIKETIIYNAFGQIINELKENSPLLDVSSLSSGIYFLKIFTNIGFEIKRFIIK